MLLFWEHKSSKCINWKCKKWQSLKWPTNNLQKALKINILHALKHFTKSELYYLITKDWTHFTNFPLIPRYQWNCLLNFWSWINGYLNLTPQVFSEYLLSAGHCILSTQTESCQPWERQDTKCIYSYYSQNMSIH